MRKRILCLWLPRWPIQRRIVARPPLRGQPIVLHARDVRRGECVQVCSTAALRRGIRVGMPLAEAISLLEAATPLASEQLPSRRRKPADGTTLRQVSLSRQRLLSEAKVQHALVGHAGRGRESFSGNTVSAIVKTSPEKDSRPLEAASGPHFEAHQPEADRAGLLQLAAWCEQFSPCVGLETHPEPQSLLLDVTGLGPLFGGEEALAWRAIEAFARRGYAVRAAVADTVGAAWAVSRFGADPRSASKSNAGKAKEGPVRQTGPGATPRIVSPGEHVAALSPLAIEALRLPPPTLAALHQLGVFQIGQALALPRASLASRFQFEGECALLERLDQAAGAVEELIAPHRPPPEFGAELCLEEPLSGLSEALAILRGLFEGVCRELAARGQGALRTTCRLDCEGGEVRKLDLGLFQPTASAERLLELAEMQLERMRLPGEVGRVGVEVEIAAPLAISQQVLFAEQGRNSPRKLALLIDRLSSRLGADHVVRPRLLPDAQPERAFCEASLVGRKEEKRKAESRKRKKKSGEAGKQAFPLPSAFRFPPSAFEKPLRLWSPPLPIEAVALADGPPAIFRAGRRRFRVQRWWGPERIETAWWRGRSVCRDYYRVETTDGAHYWLFRHLRSRRWFLHGEYG